VLGHSPLQFVTAKVTVGPWKLNINLINNINLYGAESRLQSMHVVMLRKLKVH